MPDPITMPTTIAVASSIPSLRDKSSVFPVFDSIFKRSRVPSPNLHPNALSHGIHEVSQDGTLAQGYIKLLLLLRTFPPCHSECYMGLRPTNGHESRPSLSFRAKPRTVWCRRSEESASYLLLATADSSSL